MQVFGFVANGLPIGWPKLDRWHLVKTIWLLRFYISWFQFDPWPYVNVLKTILLGRRVILKLQCI